MPASGIENILEEALKDLPSQTIDLSDKKNRKLFTEKSASEIIAHFETGKIIVIRDAQYLVHLQELIEESLGGNNSLILTFSFSPELDEILQEVLSMNKLEMFIFPPTFYELAQFKGVAEIDSEIEQRLIYGSFDKTLTDPENAGTYLISLLDDVIRTNLGAGERINKSEKLMRMLQLLAFNIGEQISFNDLGEKCGLDNETVERYIDLLEKAFILVKLPSLFNGHRYELKKSHTVFFMDNGIRNALIQNFNPLMLRNDMDALWKNWLISERVKWLKMNGLQPELYFWRTHTRQQMDYIEKYDSSLYAYKTDWVKKKTPKFPEAFKTAYADTRLSVLNRSTYWNFLTKK